MPTLEKEQTDPKIVEEARRFLWDNFPEHKREFGKYETFNAFLDAAKAGRVKVYSSAPSMGGPTNETNDQRLKKLETEKEAQEFWDRTPAAREEFGRFQTFLAYWAAMRQGQVASYGFGWERPKQS